MKRSGATVLELIVVVGIIGTLMGIALPAVLKVRQSMAKTQCAAQMRELSLAMHQYHDARGAFPPGRASARQSMAWSGWPVFLLPYIEQPNLYREIREAYAQRAHPFYIPPHEAGATHIRQFVCPADPRTTEAANVVIFNFATMYPEQRRVGLLSYQGVSGLDRKRTNGTLYESSNVNLAWLTDGTSHTIVLGERPPSENLRLGWWYVGVGDDKQTGTADFFIGVREIAWRTKDCGTNPYRFVPGQFSGPCDYLHFWSPHSGGASFAFGDGSVRFLDYSADRIIEALATRAGREPVEW